jgi:hypothetical protein
LARSVHHAAIAAELPGLDSAASLRLLEVSCGGTPWTEAGGRLLTLSPDRAVTVWDGVFFKLARARDFRAVGQEPDWLLQIDRRRRFASPTMLEVIFEVAE